MGDAKNLLGPVIMLVGMVIAPEISYGWYLLIMAGGMVVTYALAEDVPVPSLDAAAAGGAGLRANTRSCREPLRVIYGQLRVGGNDVYMGTSGDENKILWIVQTLGVGECEGIAQVDSVDQVFLGDLLYNEYGGNVSYWFHGGSSSQAVDSNLNAALSEWTDPLHYTCYMVWKLTHDPDYFQMLPNRTVVLKGKRVYDFRDTAAEKIVNGDMELDSNWADVSTPVVNVRSSEQKHGGTYSRKFTVDQPYEGIRSDDFTTVTGVRYTIGFWVYPTDTNSIRMGAYRGDAGGWNDGKDFDGLTLNAWNYVESSYTEIAGGNGAYVAIVSKEGISSGTWYIDDVTSKAFGGSSNPVLCLYDYLTSSRYGMGLDASKIDTTSWTSAANYCDTKGWTLNMGITRDEAAMDVVRAMLAHFRGELVWWDGKFYLRYADLNYESSVMTLTDKHIARDEKGKALISIVEQSRFKRPDGLRVTYIDPDRDYIVDDFPVGDEVGVIKELKLLGCTDRQQAADIGVYQLERQKLDRAVMGLFRDDALKLESHDVVTLNTSALGISSQLMRVKQGNIQPDGLIELSLIYEQLSLYDDDYNLTTEGTYKCSLPDPTAEPPSVSSVQLSEETYNYRLRTFTRLKVSFNKPANYGWYDHVEVRLSYDDATWKYLYNVKAEFEIDPVEEGTTYYIRLKVVSIWDTKQQDRNDYKTSRTIGGYIDAPASLSSLEAVVNANVINLYADKVSDPDVELYEFRLGTSWSGATFLAALRSPNLSLSGVKPGNHTFMANTLSNNGLYGSTPRSAIACLKDPPDGWSLQATEPIDTLITNGDMEDDANWSNYGTPTTNERSSVQRHQETYSRKFVSDGAGDGIKGDAFTTVNSGKYGVTLWVYPDDATKVRVKVRKGDDSGDSYDTEHTGLTQDAWNEIFFTFEEGAATGGASAYIAVYDGSGDTGSWYVDDVVLMQGEYTNMAPTLYTGEAYIKCRHSGSLTGTYKSPIFDRGSSARYMTYVLDDVVVTGTGTAWNDVIPIPDIWNYIDISTRTWIEIFELPAGASVKMNLKYGDTSPPTNVVEKQEILSAIVTGQYFQVEITITDPSNAVNGLVENYDLKFCQ